MLALLLLLLSPPDSWTPAQGRPLMLSTKQIWEVADVITVVWIVLWWIVGDDGGPTHFHCQGQRTNSLIIYGA